jgi:hypothetical protein
LLLFPGGVVVALLTDLVIVVVVGLIVCFVGVVTRLHSTLHDVSRFQFCIVDTRRVASIAA